MFISCKERIKVFGWITEISIIGHMTEISSFLNFNNIKIKLILILSILKCLVQIRCTIILSLKVVITVFKNITVVIPVASKQIYPS